MRHLVLLGDSIFDNAGYVSANESVIDQLTAKMPADGKASLLAVDGDVTSDVPNQLLHLPTDTTHAFISCGGNDALSIAGVLRQPSTSVAHSLGMLTDILRDFRERYSSMLAQVKTRVEQVTVCTVYDSVPDFDSNALTALSMFNEVILKEAVAQGVAIIDLRIVCRDALDYAAISPIEPSAQGANKITDVIVKVLETHDFNAGISSVYI